MENNELKHHGVLGMKWGVRRYQNKDGSLTPAGKKRYDKEMDKLKAEEKVLKQKARTQAKIDKLHTKRRELDELREQVNDKKYNKLESKPAKKLKDLSDDELRSILNRMDMEKRYSDLTKAQQDKGHKFIKTILKEMAAPAAIDVGKQLSKSALTKIANSLLNLDDEHKVYTNNKKK